MKVILFIFKEENKADEPYYQHVIQVGESMHGISQKYGIRLRNLYRLNKKIMIMFPKKGCA